MSQINVNTPQPVETVDTSGDRTAAAGINLITVLIVLGVLAVIAWYLFTGPLRAMSGSNGSTTNINVNPAPTSININPPQPQAPAPSNNGAGSGTGASGGAGAGASTGGSTNP
ncbi:MAG: hypothetical protein NVSMB2_18660 [Chloroflexota bacterium]